MTQESKVFNPDAQIDCTGLFCPMPIVKTREAIRRMAVGQLLEMISDDPASEPDMKSWSRRTGHELLEISRNGAIYRFGGVPEVIYRELLRAESQGVYFNLHIRNRFPHIEMSGRVSHGIFA